MKPPIFVRALNEGELQQLQSGLRSKDAFTVRRCQILLASANGLPPSKIATNLGCSVASVRNAIHALAREAMRCLQEKSHRPHSTRPFLDETHAEALKELLHHSPSLWGQATGQWTLNAVADICHRRGWTPRRLTPEAIRLSLKRLGIRWSRAKQWITTPDPAHANRNSPRSADPRD